jgi:prephenate dehydratase
VTSAAIQGVRGAFSHAAGQQALGPQVEIVECRMFEAMFDAVVDGTAQYAVVPVENTLAGSVQRNMDLLLAHELHVIAEALVRVRLCLSGRPGGSIESLRVVASHPVALQQCHAFFSRHPDIEAVTAFDTAGSVKDLMSGDAAYDGAIGSELAASMYGAEVLERDLEDDDQNYTRFLVVAQEAASGDSELTKTSMAFTVPHTPGSLHEALGVLARHGVDLTRLESRPIPGRPWEYRFYADLRGSTRADREAAVADLASYASELRVLGHYAEAPRDS